MATVNYNNGLFDLAAIAGLIQTVYRPYMHIEPKLQATGKYSPIFSRT